MRNQFVFSVDEYPSYFHFATVRDDKVHVLWDTDYIAGVLNALPEGWYDVADKVQVEGWIKNGGWIVHGARKPQTALKGQFIQLQLGFDALEEGFQSLRSEFERLKQEG